MKPKVLWVLRHLVISVGFLYATGIPSSIYQINHEKGEPDRFETFSEEEFETLEISPKNQREYLDSLSKLRSHQDSAGSFTAYLYGHDLKQFRMYQKKYLDSLNLTVEGRMLFMNYSWNSNNIINSFMGGKARDMSFSMADFDRSMDYWFPKKAEDGKAAPMPTWKDFGRWLIGWSGRFYLYGMPWALFLFLIWKFSLKKDFVDGLEYWQRDERLPGSSRAPLSFLFSILFWPIVLAVDIYNRKNDLLKRAEVISRRGTLLSLFSKQEDRLLELGKKMTKDEFRHHLDEIGLTRKHSFAVSLLATLFLVMVPFVVKPHSVSIEKNGVAVVHVDHDVGHPPIAHAVYGFPSEMTVPEPVHLVGLDLVVKKISYVFQTGKTRRGFKSGIDSVPKWVVISS